MNVISNVTDESANEIILSGEKVVIKFGAKWCSQCRILEPIYDSVASKIKGVVFAKCDVDNAPKFTEDMGIMSLPCVLIFEDGSVSTKLSGYVDESELSDAILDV